VRRRGLWYNPSACRNVGRVNRVCARAPEQRTATTRATVRAALLGAILVAFMTAPMITRPASVGRLDTNDGHYAIWNVAWVAHAILDPEARVFDANIFAPHRGTLAYSEMNLVAGVLALPWYAATHDPLVALNGTVFVALVLAFVLTSVLVRRLTGSEGAGLVAATAFTFCPYVAAHTAHIQLLMIWVFPLVMLAFHAFEERPGAWRGGALGVSLAVGALACGYYGLFMGCALGLVAMLAARRDMRYWLGLGAAILAAAVVVYPVFSAFLEARAASGAELRPWQPSDAQVYSANVTAWLASAALAHEWWLPVLLKWELWKEVLFPGLTLLLLAAGGIAIAVRQRASRRLVFLYGALAVFAFWGSFGPAGGLYLLMHELVPGMSLLRAPSRLGILAIFALAVIAGVCVARLERRSRWVPVALVALLVAELGVRTAEWGWPSWPLRERPPVLEAYQRLANLPRGVLLEFPFPYVSSDYHNHARAMFWSTYHWQPLANGYSDLVPPDFHEMAVPINAFPSDETLVLARARGVRYVLWHADRYEEAGRAVLTERLNAFEDYLRPIVVDDRTWLYEIVR
jgi:hypothetical protein